MARKTAPQPEEKRDQDDVLRYARVAAWLGAAAALILGLCLLFLPMSGIIALHMGSGLLAVMGIWLSAIRLAQRRQGNMVLWIAGLLSLGGVWVALSGMSVIMHLVAMLLAVGLSALGAALSTKAPDAERR